MRRFCLFATLFIAAALPVRAQGLPAGIIFAAEAYDEDTGQLTYCYLPGGTTCTAAQEPDTLILSQGAPLTFGNAGGTEHHSVTSFRLVNNRPAFSTPLIAPGGTADVTGVSGLEPGRYTFYCTKHQYQRGALVIA